MPQEVEPIAVFFYPSLRISVSARLKSQTSRTSLYLVECYLNGLIVQWNRLAEDCNLSDRLLWSGALQTSPEARNTFAQLQLRRQVDLHFYLICWDKVDKHLRLFERAQGDAQVSARRGTVLPLLSKAVLARHFLEHLDKHVPAGSLGITAARWSGSGDFEFSYEDISRRNRKTKRSVTLGRSEVLAIIEAYIEILVALGVPPEEFGPFRPDSAR